MANRLTMQNQALSPYLMPSPDMVAVDRFQPYKKLHQRLRGRYVWMILFGVLGAVGGAYYGYGSQKLTYRSEALLEVRYATPTVLQRTEHNEPMQMYNEFLQSQTLLLQSRPVIEAAINTDAWRQASRGLITTPQDFVEGLKVEAPNRTQALRIAYTAATPELAAAGVRALVDAYTQRFANQDREQDDQRLRILQERGKELAQKLETLLSQLNGMEVGISDQQIAVVDDLMRQYLTQRNALETELLRLQSTGRGESNPAVLQAKLQYEQNQKNMDAYAAAFMKYQAASAQSATPAGRGAKLPEYEALAAEVARIREQANKIDDRINALQLESRLGNSRLEVLTSGEVPTTPYKDRRIAVATAGGMGGAVVGMAFILMLTFLDKRVRYSDQATGLNIPGEEPLPLLGLLPRLPRRINDLALAGVAAHCVHHLRIRLYSHRKNNKPRVLSITSSCAGEGKSSLTLALGYSLSASGTRTLLIDFDIVGRGLTRQLNAAAAPGLLDGLHDADLRWVQPVSPNLDLLPAGQGEAVQASGLSPVSVLKLMTEARKHYDQVIVDTGPVAASLEAPLAAMASDDVVLVVAKGQRQPVVERTITFLRDMGAPLIGFVFNRASLGEYHREVYTSSMGAHSTATARRVEAAAASDRGQRAMGPLATSVKYFLPDVPQNGKH